MTTTLVEPNVDDLVINQEELDDLDKVHAACGNCYPYLKAGQMFTTACGKQAMRQKWSVTTDDPLICSDCKNAVGKKCQRCGITWKGIS